MGAFRYDDFYEQRPHFRLQLPRIPKRINQQNMTKLVNSMTSLAAKVNQARRQIWLVQYRKSFDPYFQTLYNRDPYYQFRQYYNDAYYYYRNMQYSILKQIYDQYVKNHWYVPLHRGNTTFDISPQGIPYAYNYSDIDFAQRQFLTYIEDGKFRTAVNYVIPHLKTFQYIWDDRYQVPATFYQFMIHSLYGRFIQGGPRSRFMGRNVAHDAYDFSKYITLNNNKYVPINLLDPSVITQYIVDFPGEARYYRSNDITFMSQNYKQHHYPVDWFDIDDPDLNQQFIPDVSLNSSQFKHRFQDSQDLHRYYQVLGYAYFLQRQSFLHHPQEAYNRDQFIIPMHLERLFVNPFGHRMLDVPDDVVQPGHLGQEYYQYPLFRLPFGDADIKYANDILINRYNQQRSFPDNYHAVNPFQRFLVNTDDLNSRYQRYHDRDLQEQQQQEQPNELFDNL